LPYDSFDLWLPQLKSFTSDELLAASLPGLDIDAGWVHEADFPVPLGL
jgi:hypothetical protein